MTFDILYMGYNDISYASNYYLTKNKAALVIAEMSGSDDETSGGVYSIVIAECTQKPADDH